MFSSLLKVSKLQKSRKHKENHHLRKINCFFFFLPFWESSGLEMAGWLAGLGASKQSGRSALRLSLVFDQNITLIRFITLIDE